MVELLVSKDQGVQPTVQEQSVKREDFGSGKAGQIAFDIIENRALCQIAIDSKSCGVRAISTLDFDVPKLRQVEFVPVCSFEHQEVTRKAIAEELAAGGQQTTFGRNGFGRG